MEENQTTSIAFQFEVVADEQYPTDPATLGEVDRFVAQELRKMGYTIERPSTGERGGEFFEAVKQVAITTWENREVIAAVANGITTIIETLTKMLQRRKEKNNESLSVKLEVSYPNGASLKLEGKDPETLGKALEEVKKQLPEFIEASSQKGKPRITAHMQQISKRRRK